MLASLWYADDVVTEAQLDVGKSRLFASEHDADAVFLSQLDNLLHGFTGFDNLGKLRTAFTMRRTHEPVQAFRRFLPRRHRASSLQQIARAMAEHDGLHVRAEILRAIQHDEVGQSHRGHRARRGTDIPRHRRLDEDDGYIVEMPRRAKRQRWLRIFFIGLTHAN